MNSSGIKRGLATTAISALAVTGLPFLATSASAVPLEDRTPANDVEFYAPLTAGISDEFDGTNNTISLVVGGGTNVASVLFQYSTDGGTTWIDIDGAVARNADGVFALDWAGAPATVTDVRAVPNTGATPAETSVSNLTDAAGSTVELATEGDLGVFQSPYSDAGEPAGQYVIADGTTSEAGVNVTVTDASNGTGASDTVASTDADGATGAGTTGEFAAILDIDGYTYDTETDPNQIALNAATPTTDDAEGSTLYRQTITSITATPETQEIRSGDSADVTLTVLDQRGNPVANAQVGRSDGPDTDTDGTGADTDTDTTDVILGYTDANGQFVTTQSDAGTSQYYANTTNNDPYEPGTDPVDTASVTVYDPTVTTVDVVNERSRSNFDLDEIADGDDFTIETQDQRGKAFGDGDTIQYRWVVDPTATGAATETSQWQPATDLNNDGVYEVPGLTDAQYSNPAIFPAATGARDLPNGSYTLEARRPNDPLTGTGLMNASPETFNASESEITFDEGDVANANVEGETILTGTLALIDGGAGLPNREFVVTFGADGVNAREDARFVDGPGVDANAAGTSAVVVTDANGKFSISIDDQAGPANVPDNPESFAVIADQTQETPTDGTMLKGDNGAQDPAAPEAAANAADRVVVNFRTPPAVAAIEVSMQELAGNAAPGRPVDFDIIVREEDGVNDGSTTNNPVAKDLDVQVSVDKGFLSPNAESADDLDLADGHDATGDLWGFFKNDGTDETVTTGDSGTAGVVAAIERDPSFDDDGLSTMTVTIKAGDKTVTRTIEFDATNVLNMVEGDLDPAEGEPSGQVPVTEDVDFQLYTYDQFENLVGNRFAQVSDDSTVADFRTDGQFGETRTDFTVSGPGITAFSDAPTTQTLTARVAGNESLVGANESQDTDTAENFPVVSDPIEWVAGGDGPINAGLTLRGGDNGAADDSLFANAHRQTEGAVVKLFRRKSDGTWKFIRKGIMNAEGNFRFKNVNDLNGNKVTRYKAIVKATDDTRRGVGKKRVR